MPALIKTGILDDARKIDEVTAVVPDGLWCRATLLVQKANDDPVLFTPASFASVALE